MSAPAAICYSKLLLPETRRSLTSIDNIQPVEKQDQSALSAATRGATNGIALILNIIANLVAFVSFIAFLNGVVGYCGGMLGRPDLDLEWIFGKIFIPLSWLMGVPWEECEHVGTLIGLKTIVNEFVAYQRMGQMKKDGLLSPRAELIATYSLCGFTNPASAGIMIGAIASMAPNQRETLSSIAVRAFFAGCGICFMTACIAAQGRAHSDVLALRVHEPSFSRDHDWRDRLHGAQPEGDLVKHCSARVFRRLRNLLHDSVHSSSPHARRILWIEEIT
ncbi:jg22477 [Pararge aegeria aegeria]|uniref:Jg22477 protein n=1 Tax=Pararge aegeria aegeria TaxID=348720 RepID=A0A8S4SFM2_9NEOP|nr:jg22477 [Pararge aegeria aegeria]